MGQRPVAIRIKVVNPNIAHEEHVVVGVAEAARRLNVSERTVYRMLKSGELERGNGNVKADASGSIESDMKSKMRLVPSRKDVVTMSTMSDSNGVELARKDAIQIEILRRQINEKDAQITQLMTTQQELTRAIQRLQEQMYELAHLVLTHNAAAAQAKAEAELKTQEIQAKPRGGLAGLLGGKGRK